MPPDPDMTQSADEDDNSDPFADVKIDEDIDNAMKFWVGLMDKKHSKPKMKNVACGILSALKQTSNVFGRSALTMSGKRKHHDHFINRMFSALFPAFDFRPRGPGPHLCHCVS